MAKITRLTDDEFAKRVYQFAGDDVATCSEQEFHERLAVAQGALNLLALIGPARGFLPGDRLGNVTLMLKAMPKGAASAFQMGSPLDTEPRGNG